MITDRMPILRWALVNYVTDTESRSFLERVQTQVQRDVEVTVAVLDAKESQRYFGVPMARRGMQPVWVRVVNRSGQHCRLSLLAMDPNYFSSHEAAAANRFKTTHRLWAFGLLFWFLLPMWLLIAVLWPLRIFTARRANRKMDAFFQQHAMPLRPIDAGATSEGFVFTSLDAGSKAVHVRLMGQGEPNEFLFTVQVPGFDADYLRHGFQERYRAEELVDCDVEGLREYLLKAPRATTNAKGSREGDPVNLVVAGEFATVLSAFCGRWDETEIISLATCWKTARAFLMGSEYRYSPISPLFLFGRSQDFALQRIRQSINERLHLRLWATPLRFEGRRYGSGRSAEISACGLRGGHGT